MGKSEAEKFVERWSMNDSLPMKDHSDLVGTVRVEEPFGEGLVLHEKMTAALEYIHNLRKTLEASREYVGSFIVVNMKDVVNDKDNQLFTLLRGLYPDLDVWKEVDQLREGGYAVQEK